MGVETGFELVKGTFTNTTFFGIGFFVFLLVVFISILLITRNINEWARLFFPVSIMWFFVFKSYNASLLILTLAGIIYILDVFSVRDIGDLIKVNKSLPKLNIGIMSKTEKFEKGLDKIIKQKADKKRVSDKVKSIQEK